MADITVRVEASGENLAKVTAELLELLTVVARLDARPVEAPVDGLPKAGTGFAVDELLVAGPVSVRRAQAAASVLVTWARNSTRRLVLASETGELVVDATALQADVENWLGDRG